MRPFTRFALLFTCAACGASEPPATGDSTDAGGGSDATAPPTDAGTDANASADAATSDAAADAGIVDASSDADAHAPLAIVSHSGRWMLDAQGRVLIVHGFNVVNKLAPYTAQGWSFDEDDAAFLEASGFNAVRLGVLWVGVEPHPGQFDAAYVAAVKKTQQLLASHGIYTLLDWHQDELNEMFGGEGIPAWTVDTGGLAPSSPHETFPNEYDKDPAQKAAWDNLYANKPGTDGMGPRDHLAAAEAYVASQFAGEPWVLGYDVINEPSGGSLSEPAADTSALGPLELALMKSIRTVDTKHLVFYEPTTTFALNGIALPAFGDSNAGISFHDYCLEPGSLPDSVYSLLCGGVLSSSQTSAIAHASSGGGDAVLMTEFGSATAYAVRMVAENADANMVPWLYWAYCGCGDPTTAIDPSKEGIVLDPTLSPTTSNLNAPVLAILERPYPQAIAGTPTSWAFDAMTHTFTLAYSTASPPGATLTPGATTVVYLPATQYPNGYTATVTGGSVVAGSGTPRIAIAASAGVASVSVRVTKN